MPLVPGVEEAIQRIVEIPGLRDELDAARSAIDELLWRRDVRGSASEFAAGSRARGSRDSAAMDGADIFEVDDSPMGRVLGAAAAITAEVPAQVDVFTKAPLQALARLHAVAAADEVSEPQLGRPRVDGETADDPLRFGDAPPAREAAGRLALLGDLVTQSANAPALAIAGIVHAELLTARPFVWGSGLVGRASVRLVLAGRGVDPSLFSVPETGMMNVGRPAYVRALRDYVAGDMVAYFRWFATAIASGAQAATPGVPGEAQGDGS